MQNRLYSFKGTDVPTSRPYVQSEDKEKNVAALPAVAPDYNVKLRFAYSQLEDIKISDDLTAKCYKLCKWAKSCNITKRWSNIC